MQVQADRRAEVTGTEARIYAFRRRALSRHFARAAWVLRRTSWTSSALVAVSVRSVPVAPALA